MTRDRWGEVNLISKFQLPSIYGLGVKVSEDTFTSLEGPGTQQNISPVAINELLLEEDKTIMG